MLILHELKELSLAHRDAPKCIDFMLISPYWRGDPESHRQTSSYN